MKLAMLGTNGYIPTDDGQTACFMLPEVGIMLDAGSGAFRVSDYLQTPTLDVYLSHAHGDHINGLTYLPGAMLKKAVQETRPEDLSDFESLISRSDAMLQQIRILAKEEVLEGVYKRLTRWPNTNYVALEDEQPLPQNGTMTVFPVEHGVPCYGFRLDWPGHSMAYVTDTTADPDAPYVEHLRGVDLLLHDGYMPDMWEAFARRTNHSFTLGVAQVAAKAAVGRLVLIHNLPLGLPTGAAELAAARAIFPATEVGLDRMEIEF